MCALVTGVQTCDLPISADMLRHQAAERRRGGRDGGHADRVLEEATEVEPMGSPLPVGAPLGRFVQLFDHDLSMLKVMQSIMGFFCTGQLASLSSKSLFISHLAAASLRPSAFSPRGRPSPSPMPPPAPSNTGQTGQQHTG